MRRVEPERPQLRRTGLSAAAKAGEPAYPLYPQRGWRGGHSAPPLRSPEDPRSGGVREQGASPPNPLAVALMADRRLDSSSLPTEGGV